MENTLNNTVPEAVSPEAQETTVMDGNTDTASNTGVKNEPGKPEKKQDKTFTQDELNGIIQKRLAEERERVKREAEERERRLSMTLEERERELLMRETDLRKKEMRADAIVLLAAKDMPAELTAFLDYSSYENLQSSVETIGVAFNKAVQQGVLERFRNNGRTPSGVSGTPPSKPDEDVFVKAFKTGKFQFDEDSYSPDIGD